MNHWSNLTCVGCWGRPVTVQTAVVWTKAAARSGANTRMRFLCGQAVGMKGRYRNRREKTWMIWHLVTFLATGVFFWRGIFFFNFILHSAYATDLEAWTHHSAGVPEFCKLNTSRQPNIGPTMTEKNLKHKTHARTAKIICWDLFEMLLFFFLPFLKHTTDNTLHYCITLWFCVVYSTSC